LLENIIGQDKVKKYLAREIKSDTLSYGYIIEGNKFMGKEYIAEQIAEEITVPSYVTKLTPSEDRKLLHVDDIRELRNGAYSVSFGSAKKVYILPDADEMTQQAQNAFLKILEEPPQDCIFILLAENRFNLLSTIRSRCTTLTLSRYTDKEIKEYLVRSGIEYNSETVRLCDGTLNKYLYLNTKEFANVNELALRILLNIRQLHSARLFAIFKHVKKLKGYEDDLLDIFLLFYRDIDVYLVTTEASAIESESMRNDVILRANQYTANEVLSIIDQIEFCRTKLYYNCNLEMSFNTLLLYMKGDVK
jgi:DNA polymerase-3 subunit delta'